MTEADQDELISIIEESGSKEDIPHSMPMMPVRDIVIFSDMLLPLFVGRDKSIKAVENSAENNRFIFLAAQKDSSVENPKASDVYSVGTVGKILRILKLPDGRIKILVQGICRAKINKYTRVRSFFRVKTELVDDVGEVDYNLETEALMRSVRENCEKIMSLKGEMTGDIGVVLESITEPGKLADLVASNLRLKIEEAQELLEMTDQMERLKKANDYLYREVELSAVQAKIQSNVKDEISKSQRDYYLREQVRAIHKELGELDDKNSEINEYKLKIKKAKMTKEAQVEASKQVKRLEQMHQDSSEASIIRTYLDWLVEMPWSKSTKDFLDIKKAKVVLDDNHHGLEKIKDRILEFLSVRKLNPTSKGPILCLAGPPGVGKTSLGQAIAKAMKRKFVRLSLGGIHDEAEIRGHRRTYIGAMPGRILQGLKQCKTNNPIFMLDEIDKLGSDYRGDPSSALLEALDPEQNSEFSDHYLNLSFDLSKVMFILTANVIDTIPSALYDRMEVIHLSGYTPDEKQSIAESFLIPRQIKENGLTRKNISISSGALKQVISEYTSEAGVRNLERKLGTLCRKVARQKAEGNKSLIAVTKNNIRKYLGQPDYSPEMDQEESQVGLSTGLAWTHVGGEALYIESTLLPGKGDIILTGQLGDVMQESARAAFSYIKANIKQFGKKADYFDQVDIHVHVPAGAIPKDGPSAGIAIATSLVSLITDQKVDKYVAMTGEITLRGRVLPIGGLKDKALGALNAGIKTVIIPEKNKKDLHDIPLKVKRKIKFLAVKNMEEVLETALIKTKKPTRKSRKSKSGK